ncbi:DUF4240 domain-containing protein [Streptomyces cylindrosporus]|uniref:DUF4240 domain-containing protein n=1 Tax=Streptomyces cylindrosporus TaxID=2927583 RepID=A0ABS9Y4X4_9ACTN|nr:DUF4240 domain-containing protein [Streptomyces cylindrosporus]MCI3272277.1 DUF4240 domain-containing protein [Streptomyces cylindrosporus]
MTTDDFWHLVETARNHTTPDRPFDQALVELLSRRTRREILEYQECFDELREALYRWDVWAAAYLIGGGCSDDSFMDFRAGLIAQGREWYERAAAAPDSLAEHPAVLAAGDGLDERALFFEEVNYCAAGAFEVVAGSVEGFYEAWKGYAAERPDPSFAASDMGEDFDFDDPSEMRRRLPRLAGVFLSEKSG